MAAVVKETLMSAETFDVDIDNTPELFDLVATRSTTGRVRPRKLQAEVYDADDVLVYPPMVLLTVAAGPEGIVIGGTGPLWHTGSNGIGPTVTDREYFSGQSRLSDGGYELGDLLYFKPAEGSTWTTSSSAHTGALAAYHAADTDTDDPLAADEVFTAHAGEEWTAKAWVARIAGAIGRLHLRLVFTGRFTPADVLTHDWVNVSEFPGDMDETSPGVFRIGPNERKQIIINGGAETGTLANWVSYSGTWGPTTTNPRSGAYSFDIGSGVAFAQLVSDSTAGGLDQGYDVLPGEVWVIGDYIQPGAGADGKAYIHVLLGGVVAGVPNTPIQQVKSIEIENNSITAGAWNLVAVEVQVPPDAVLPYLSISKVREGITTGNVYFDDAACIRTKGNRGYLAHGSAWFFTPLRTYKWTAKVATTGPLVSGSMRFGLTLIGVGRPNIYIESQPFDGRSDVGMIEWSFTPPSGYEAGNPVIVSDDIYGGHFVVTEMHCYDQDTGTFVVDTDSAASGGWAQLTRAFAAPVGTDSVHAEVVAEAGAGGWLVDDLDLTRTGVPISTGNDIIADALTQPETGDPLSLGPGTINCPETIPYDLPVVRLTNRALLDHYCTVVSDPTREYRCNATVPATIDVATADELFTTHPLASAIRPADLEVESLSSPATDATDRPTHIELVGATRRTLSGRDILITATAAVPGDVEYDFNGRAIVRTKTESRGTVDHIGYAQALATDLALREAEPELALSVTLSGTTARADVPPGDTIHVYHPPSGLTAYPDNPTTIDGQPAFPVPVRVLARERVLGPGYRIVMRRPDGSTFDLPFTASDRDTVTLTLGDRLPSWVADPDGRAEGVQFVEWYQSRPR